MPTSPEQKFSARALDIMQGFTESTSMRIGAQEKATTENTKAIAQISNKVDKLADSIGAQKESIDRLERAVASLVSGIESQRRTMQDMISHQSEFLRTTNKALDIIDRLTSTRAA